MTPQGDLYEILGVPRDANFETIKYAFRRRAKATHPDAGGRSSDFEILVQAKRILTDQRLRDRYDATGDTDSLSKDKRTAKAMEILAQTLVTVMGNTMRFDVVDVVDVMKRTVQLAIDQGKAHVKQHQHAIERIEQVRDRLFCLPDTPNRLGAVLEGQIRMLRLGIVRAEENLELHELACDMLKDYSYRTDQKLAVTGAFSPSGF